MVSSWCRCSRSWPCGILPVAAALLLCTGFTRAPAERTIERVGTFLVASSRLIDPRFRESVVLITQQNEHGTAGLIVNRPSEITLASAFPHNSALQGRSERLHFGGPVSLESILLLVRSSERPRRSIHVFGDTYMSSDVELLEEKSGSDFAGRVRVFAGHAGWQPGQLRAEIERGDWYTVKADEKTIFEVEPGSMWRKLIEGLAGHWVRRDVESLRIYGRAVAPAPPR